MVELPQTDLIWQALQDAAEKLPDKPGLVYNEKEISFKEMDEASDRVASGLLKLGYRKGDRIGIIALNQPEWLYTYFAAAKIGAVIVGLNVRYRDTAHVCQVTGVLWFLASPIIYPAELVPARLHWIIACNPISGVIGLFRHALLGLPAPSSAAFGLSAAFVAIGFGAGWCWHVKTGSDLMDHL